jgi:hypothetical protein
MLLPLSLTSNARLSGEGHGHVRVAAEVSSHTHRPAHEPGGNIGHRESLRRVQELLRRQLHRVQCQATSQDSQVVGLEVAQPVLHHVAHFQFLEVTGEERGAHGGAVAVSSLVEKLDTRTNT